MQTDRRRDDDGGSKPNIGIAAVLANPDITDPRDERVGEAIETHRRWVERREAGVDREQATLGEMAERIGRAER